MKLRNIFTALTAALVLAFAGCQEPERFLDEIQVAPQSMISIPVDGGQVEVTITATEDWEFAEIPDVWPTLVTRDKDGKVVSEEPSWLSVDKMSDAAGKSTVTLSATATKETRELALSINCGKVAQVINVLQMAEKVEIPITSCATVLAENSVGTVYKVKGTITDLTNYDKYGCFYVNDGTATVYVYGSMNYAQFKPEVGDIITFEGPWTSYGNFDDATIVSLEKSLIKLEKVFPAEALPLEGGVATVLLTVKEGDLEIVIPEDAEWLTAGEPSTLGGMTSVELTAAENNGGARSTTVTFKVNVGGKDYLAMADIEQLGAIAEVSVADFLAAEVGKSLYKLTGKVANLQAGDYGNFDLVDATGSVYVYGLTATQVEKNDKSFPTLGLQEGDIVTLVGTRADYKGTAQVGGPAYYVSHIGHKTATVAEFIAAAEDDTRYMLTGTVANIVMDKEDPTKQSAYGNFDLVDETGSVYVYGLTVAPVEKNDKSFPTLGLKEGDKVTIIGTRTSYKGTVQVGGPAYYVSHETPAVEEPVEPETPAASTVTLTNAEILAALTSSETSYTEYTIASASGEWTVNASQNKNNTYLQCRGKKGAYIKTPLFEKDIKSVTIHFSEAKSVYADNVYCVFPATWTVPTADEAYPEDGNVGKAVTDGSYSLTIPVAEGNKQVYVTIIGTYAYYLDHIDVELK